MFHPLHITVDGFLVEAEVVAVEREAAQRLALAQFDREGRSRYPDATGTLRLSFGVLRGWQEAGAMVPTRGPSAARISRRRRPR